MVRGPLLQRAWYLSQIAANITRKSRIQIIISMRAPLKQMPAVQRVQSVETNLLVHNYVVENGIDRTVDMLQ